MTPIRITGATNTFTLRANWQDTETEKSRKGSSQNS